VLDNFNRADGAVGSAWTPNEGSALQILTNQLSCGAGITLTEDGYWNGLSGLGDCEVYVSAVNASSTSGSSGVSVGCRYAPGSGLPNGYYMNQFFQVGGARSTSFYRYDAGAQTRLGATLTTVAQTSLGISASGSTFTCYGTGWASLGSRTDATYSTGYLAVKLDSGVDEVANCDDFGGGSLGAAPVRPMLRTLGGGVWR
jgi:hypothetical protein